MVAVAFFVDFVAVGFFFYSYGVFFKAIAAEFGDSRLGVSLGLTATSLVGAVVAPVVGFALDRYSLKRIIALGSTSMAVGFLALSQVRTPLQFYLSIGIFIGFGASAMGSLATSKLVSNWFIKRRGTALGVAATGISVSGVVMPFVSAAIIEAWGWRQGFMLYAMFTGFVVIPLVLRLVISTPEEVGLKPDGALMDRAEPIQPVVAKSFTGTQTVLKEYNFWILVAVIALLYCCQSATLTHMVPRLTDAGYTLKGASLVMSLCAGFGVLGKLSFGWFGDRWPARRALWVTIGCQIIGQVAMFQYDPLIFAVGAAFFGYGMGGVVPLQSSIVGKVFGRTHFGKALGMMRPAMFPIQIIGVPLAGWVYDTTGSYAPAFMFFLLLYVIAAMVVFAFREENLR